MQEDMNRRLREAVAFQGASPGVKLVRAPLRIALARWTAWRARRGGGSRLVRSRLFWGDVMSVELPDPVSATLYCYGYYEADLTGFLLRYLSPGSVAVDIGAHVGYYSLLMSRLVGEGGTVHAFEPTPRTFAILARNLAGRGNVRLNQAAVWKESTNLDLSDFGSGLATFNTVVGGRLEGAEEAQARPSTISVPAMALDDYLEASGGRVDFLKIDAENAEAEVIDGARRILATSRPVISLEVGDLGPGGEGRTGRILSDMIAKGYAVFDQECGGLIRHRERTSYGYGNVLLAPSQRADEFLRRFPPGC